MFRPMLAATVTEADLDNLKYPVIVQCKLDGVRCVVKDGVAYSRTMKRIPNKFIQSRLALCSTGIIWDGELLLAYDATFQEITSAVMSVEGQPNFVYRVFDCLDRTKPTQNYEDRINNITAEGLWFLPYHLTYSKQKLLEIEQDYLTNYEGIIIRSPSSPYKFGRSTLKEGYLLKLKRFIDCECTILSCHPLLHNSNELETNELGLSKRSSHASGKVKLNLLGKFRVVAINGDFKGVEFDVGSGFTQAQRKQFWLDKEQMVGQTLKVKYQLRGSKDKPRCPIFLGIRKD
jgi:DNA ligase-1